MPILTENSLELTNTLIQAYKNGNFSTNFNVSEQFPLEFTDAKYLLTDVSEGIQQQQQQQQQRSYFKGDISNLVNRDN